MLCFNIAATSARLLTVVAALRARAWTHFDQRSSSEEEAEQVGKDVIADHNGDGNDEPGMNYHVVNVTK